MSPCTVYMLHVVDKYPVHKEILSIMLHEHRLLTLYRIRYPPSDSDDPSRDLRVPSASSLNRFIDCPEQLNDMPLRNRLEPRVWRRNVDRLIIFKVTIQERLLGVSLGDITPVFWCYCCH